MPKYCIAAEMLEGKILVRQFANASLCTMLTDARLETPHQVACHSVNCGGMSSLESVLNFLRQLGGVVEVSGPPISFTHPTYPRLHHIRSIPYIPC